MRRWRARCPDRARAVPHSSGSRRDRRGAFARPIDVEDIVLRGGRSYANAAIDPRTRAEGEPSTAQRRLSKTESPANTLVDWKLRASPCRAIACGGRRVICRCRSARRVPRSLACGPRRDRRASTCPRRSGRSARVVRRVRPTDRRRAKSPSRRSASRSDGVRARRSSGGPRDARSGARATAAHASATTTAATFFRRARSLRDAASPSPLLSNCDRVGEFAAMTMASIQRQRGAAKRTASRAAHGACRPARRDHRARPPRPTRRRARDRSATPTTRSPPRR